jgi:pilus assembly protein CpaB
MRRGGRLLVFLGIVLGVMTAGATFLFISTLPTNTAPPIQTRPVVIAMQNIPARTTIPAGALGIRDFPLDFAPTGAFEKLDAVVGKFALQPIYQGQAIVAPMFLDTSAGGIAGTHSNASFLVPDGKVAVAFPVAGISNVAGAIQDGDTVDILLTLSPAATNPAGNVARTTTTTTGAEGQPASQLMLQDVLILHVGNWTADASGDKSGGSANASVVTFILERQDALALKAAREQGTIELALRHAGDHKAGTTEPVNLEYLNRRFNFRLVPR